MLRKTRCHELYACLSSCYSAFTAARAATPTREALEVLAAPVVPALKEEPGVRELRVVPVALVLKAALAALVLKAALAALVLRGGAGGTGGSGATGGEGGSGGEGGAGGAITCMPAATDYPGETWEACISDDGTYHLAGDNTPSSIARIASFETIADLLWRRDTAPGAMDFLNARMEFSIDQGLESRVARRYDAHVQRLLTASIAVRTAQTGLRIMALSTPIIALDQVRFSPCLWRPLPMGKRVMHPGSTRQRLRLDSSGSST